jgi:hypothetical protein
MASLRVNLRTLIKTTAIDGKIVLGLRARQMLVGFPGTFNRWQQALTLTESLAFMRLVAWLITEEGVSVDKNGKLFTVGI